MNCDRARELLGGRSADPLLAAHLASCADCRELAGVMALAAELPEVDLPTEFEAQLRERLRAAAKTRRGWRSRLRPTHYYYAYAAGVAAAVLLAVGALHGAGAPGAIPERGAGPVAASAAPSGAPAAAPAARSFARSAPFSAAVAVPGPQAATSKSAAPAAGAAHSAVLLPSPSSAAGGGSAGANLVVRQIVRRVSLTLSVADVQTAFDRIGQDAGGLGGFVSNSTLITNGLKTQGNLDLRVPTTGLAGLLADLRQIGKVTSESQSDQDVTSQYVDLQARLTALQAEQAAYERLFAKATKIADIIQIQQQLTGVQSQIDSLEGQLRVLNNLASLATVQVTLTGPGGGAPPATVPPILQAPWRALLAAAAFLLTIVSWLLPWAVLAAIVWGIVVVVRRRRFP